MKTLTELIQNYQNGIPDSDSEILKRMEPLVKGYASRIHCMEREDSTQELYLTLLKTLPYLSSSSSEGDEYSCAVTPQVRQTGNRLSGLAGTAYASLLA